MSLNNEEKKGEAKRVNFVSTELQLKGNNREDCKRKVNIWTRQKTRPTVNRRNKQNATLAFDICILLQYRQGLLVAKFDRKR